MISRSDALKTAINWWSSDAIAIITFSPFLLLYVAPRVNSWMTAGADVHPSAPRPRRHIAVIEILEKSAQVGSVLAAIWLVFGLAAAAPYQPLYLLFIPVIWVAVRHGLPGATLTTFAINVGMMFAAYVTHAPGGGLPRLQLAMLALGLTSLCVGTVVTEGMRAEVELEKRARLEMFGAEIGTVLTRSGNLAWRPQTLCGGLRPSPRRSLGPGLVTRRLHQASSARSDYLSRRAGFFCVPKECNLLQVSGGLQNWKSSVTPSKL